jgi:hypothetical protein
MPVARFVESRIGRTRNPKVETILAIAAEFKPEWKNDLDVFIVDQGLGDAIDSIMNNRHLIAHGQHRNTGITIAKVSDFLERSVKVLEFIEAQCDR